MRQIASGTTTLAAESAWHDYSRVTTLSDMLVKGRVAKGLRQKDVAARLSGDAESQTVSNYERAFTVPSADRMLDLIELLELDPGEAWRAWGHAQLTGEEAAARAPVEDAGALEVLVERRRHPRAAGGQQGS